MMAHSSGSSSLPLQQGELGAEGEVGWTFFDETNRKRAKSDCYGFAIALVANAAILHRALPTASFIFVAHFSLYLLTILLLLCWSILSRGRYARWRSLIQACVRLESFLMPTRRQAWAQFIRQAPSWRAGRASSLLNAWIFGGCLLGQSYVGVMALLTLAHPLHLWLHLPVQLLCVGATIVHNGTLCASPLLGSEVATQLSSRLYSLLDLALVLALPLPTWPHQRVGACVKCRRVVTFAQLTLGTLLPTLVLALSEHQALKEHQEQQRQRAQRQRAEQQRAEQQQHVELEGHGAGGVNGAISGSIPGAASSRVAGWRAQLCQALYRVDRMLLGAAKAAVGSDSEAPPGRAGRAWLLVGAVWAAVCTLVN